MKRDTSHLADKTYDFFQVVSANEIRSYNGWDLNETLEELRSSYTQLQEVVQANVSMTTPNTVAEMQDNVDYVRRVLGEGPFDFIAHEPCRNLGLKDFIWHILCADASDELGGDELQEHYDRTRAQLDRCQ